MKLVQRCMVFLVLILMLALSACGGSATPQTGITSGENAPTAAAGTEAAAGTGTEGGAATAAAGTGTEGGTAAETATAGTGTEGAAAEPTPAPTSGQTSNYDAAATKLTFWLMPNGPQPIANAQAQAEAFTQANPDIGIRVELIDWSVAYNQIQTALQGGADACVTQLGTTWVSGFHPLGGLRPFTAEEIAAMGGEQAFVPASWATTRMEGSDEIVAVPWFVDSRALAYRSDILEELNLTPEEAFKDLQSFEQTLQRVKEANPDMAPFAHTGRGDWNVIQNASMFIWNYGGDILTPDNKQAAFNSDQAVDAVTFAAGLYGRGLTPPDAPEINTTQAENKLAEGQAFSTVTGPWTVGNTTATEEQGGWANREVAENIAFAEWPAGPGGQFAFVGGSQLAVLNECANPDAAVKFVQFLTSQESVIPYTQVAGFLPARVEAQENATFTTPSYEVFKNAAEVGKVPPTIPQWGGVENVMRTSLEGVWEDVAASPGTPIGRDAVKARLDAGAQSVNELLASE
ncbi:MAG TPA: extracellular solute-binding protein [Herpetosiphonaceae bacterium]|nr:extracellular solute-binding protein [Herpetosiphonaceae bacterium]